MAENIIMYFFFIWLKLHSDACIVFFVEIVDTKKQDKADLFAM